MNQPFLLLGPLELGYTRETLFALELLDPVTLDRVSEGIKVEADGLNGKPYVNSSGLFVWLREDVSHLRQVSINPQRLPYDARVLLPGDLRLPPNPRPLTTIELSPRVDYAVASGTTGARGTVIEDVGSRVPVQGADVRLRWLDEDGITWHAAPGRSQTNAKGDFVSVLRFDAVDVPRLDANRTVTVRVLVRRDASERTSLDLRLPQGRVADPLTLAALTFAWDDLQP